MNYNLYHDSVNQKEKLSTIGAIKKLVVIIGDERKNLIISLVAILINSTLSLAGPFLIGYTVDTYVQTKQFNGIRVFSMILCAIYFCAFLVNSFQMRLMGGIGQRMLFNLRNAIFNKLQQLPVDFFNQNKAGDLISRVNNDTDKVNQFFSQSLMQFIGSIVTMIGSGIFLVSLNFKLGVAVLLPALIVWLFTRSVSPWVKKLNAESMKSLGGLSAEIQESLANFKVIVAFNRRDYFRKRFEETNQLNYRQSIKSGVANNLLFPVYTFASNIGLMVVLSFGIYLISKGEFSIGFLISFIAYVFNFYHPLRQLAALWANFQVALAGWDRISKILALESNLEVLENKGLEIEMVTDNPDHSLHSVLPLLEFQDVSFAYPDGKEVLHHINFKLKRGKTYAFVGPTGGGKTTTASLIARLYDPTEGRVILENRDIRTYPPCERTKKIGFILQEPFLFTGTVRENILYGNEDYINCATDHLTSDIESAGLENLLGRFENGLDTFINTTGEGISLGQKQLIAFMRAVLRKPDLLILDEATSNVDTVTEQYLEVIINKLPATTTKVIIAHRLNTIENADEIFFVNSGNVIQAGSLEHAVSMLLNNKEI